MTEPRKFLTEDDLVWEDPPPVQQGRHKGGNDPVRLYDFIRVLSLRPGKWAIYPYSTNSGMPAQIKKRAKSFGLTVEATSRGIDGKPKIIYARVVEQ
jgi:hypothetical protein